MQNRGNLGRYQSFFLWQPDRRGKMAVFVSKAAAEIFFKTLLQVWKQFCNFRDKQLLYCLPRKCHFLRKNPVAGVIFLQKIR